MHACIACVCVPASPHLFILKAVHGTGCGTAVIQRRPKHLVQRLEELHQKTQSGTLKDCVDLSNTAGREPSLTVRCHMQADHVHSLKWRERNQRFSTRAWVHPLLSQRALRSALLLPPPAPSGFCPPAWEYTPSGTCGGSREGGAHLPARARRRVGPTGVGRRCGRRGRCGAVCTQGIRGQVE